MQSQVEVRSQRERRRVLPRLHPGAVDEVVEGFPEVEGLVAVVDDVAQRADDAGEREDGEGVAEGLAREPVTERFGVILPAGLSGGVLGGVGRRRVGSRAASSKRCRHRVTQPQTRSSTRISRASSCESFSRGSMITIDGSALSQKNRVKVPNPLFILFAVSPDVHLLLLVILQPQQVEHPADHVVLVVLLLLRQPLGL